MLWNYGNIGASHARRSCNRAFLSGIGLGALLAGCTAADRIDQIAGDEPHRVASFNEAASVHVAVLSATRFESIGNELQPHFPMDEAKALEEVVPNTQLLVERVLDVVERSLRLMPPQTSVTQTSTTHSGTGTDTKEAFDRTRSKAPGAIPGAAPVPGGTRTAGALTAATPGAPGERAVDPFTKYKAAAALLQEIRLLNQYVIARQLPEGTTAQVVRLQISVFPYARNQPYDVYTNVSFFPEGFKAALPGKGELLSLEEKSAGSKGIALAIPLLATDNFEASSQSSGAEAVQQAALSLLGLLKGFGIGADYGRLLDQIRSVTGRELNALLTTSSLTNNTLRVRLGAPFSTKAGYSMVPQTYAVSAVLILPADTTRVNIVARSTLRDAITGAALTERPRTELFQRACERLAGYTDLPGNPLFGNGTQKDIKKILKHPQKYCSRLQDEPVTSNYDFTNIRTEVFRRLQDVEYSRFREFRDALARPNSMRTVGDRLEPKGPGEYNDTITALWSGFADLLAGSSYSRAWFAVTDPILPAPQSVVANDDGKTVSATLVNGRDLSISTLGAQLELPLKGAKKESSGNRKPTRTLQSTTVQIQDGFTAVKLTFPSPKLLNLEIDPARTATIILSSGKKPVSYVTILQTDKSDPETQPTLAFSVGAAAVDARGNASVQLQLRDAKLGAQDAELYLRCTGGDLVEFTPAAALTPTAKGWRFASDKPIKLTLSNVRDSTDLVFTLLGKDAQSKLDESRLDVWPLAQSRSSDAAVKSTDSF